MDISVIDTKTIPTVQVIKEGKRIVFHSKYNPINEVDAWVRTMGKVLKKEQPILVIGVGAGYHIQKLAQTYPEQKIIAVEFNERYYSWFQNSEFYYHLASLENVEIHSFFRLSKNEQKNLFSDFSSTNIGIHKSGLDIFPNEHPTVLQLLEDLQYHQRTVIHQIDSLYENFNKNVTLNDPSLTSLKNTYTDRPMILVSAGPSLTKQLPLLQTVSTERKISIGAVGTAIKPLLTASIVPDFFMITDPQEATLTQLSNVHIPEAKLFYLSTAFHETVLSHAGDRYIVYQKGFTEAEIRAKKHKEPLIQTGGSVATSLLDTMVCLGAKSIALVGQDLAYTDGISHAKGAHLQVEVPDTSNQLQTQNYEQNGLVYTSKNLTIYRKWFEKYAEENPRLVLYNCTEGGANIKNWGNIPLEEYMKLFD